jgi:serine/threonine protein phosphatase PrpC
MAASSSAVVHETGRNPRRRGMGTTLTAILLQHEEQQPVMRWISVGDSPLWRISSSGRIERLNADHSLAGQLEAELASGRLSRVEAADDPRRDQSNVLIHVLNGEPLDMGVADFRREPMPLAIGDTIVLATDGVETLEEVSIADYVIRAARKYGRPTASGLLDAVLDCGYPYQDNVSIAMIRISRARSFWGFFPHC